MGVEWYTDARLISTTTSEWRRAFSLYVGRDSTGMVGSTNHGMERMEAVQTSGMTLMCVMAVVRREKEYNNTRGTDVRLSSHTQHAR